MCLNSPDILYIFDILGPSPKLLIFNNERYKSFVSSIISIIQWFHIPNRMIKVQIEQLI